MKYMTSFYVVTLNRSRIYAICA